MSLGIKFERDTLIGIAGPARSGKDTVAQYLVDCKGFHQFSFAEPIRAALKAMFCIDQEYFEGERKTKPIFEDVGGEKATPRILMQTLGTEWGRNMIHPDLWLHLVAHGIRDYQRICYGVTHIIPRAVISDVRFENEAQWVRAQGGTVLHLRRPGVESGGLQNHQSENGVLFHPHYDALIENDSTLSDLVRSVELALAWCKTQT